MICCPSSNCGYFGFIKRKECRDSLECEKCLYKWRDPSQYTWSEKLSSNFKKCRSMDFKILTQIHHLCFEEPCPKCGVHIQKNGGCPHMVCGKCKYEFCWRCLSSYKGYIHQNPQHFCPMRTVMLNPLLLILCILLNFKLV